MFRRHGRHPLTCCVCFLLCPPCVARRYTGKALLLSKAVPLDVQIGLVRSSWGGTSIHAWSSPDAIAKCPGSPSNQTAAEHAAQGSALFNGMIAPFIGLQFKAVVWYQGESDTGPDHGLAGPKYYGCALGEMIKDWRLKFGIPSLPFLVVELSAYCNEDNEKTFHTWCDQQSTHLTAPDPWLPAMRLAQQAGVTAAGANTVMVSAMDLGSLHPLAGSIHSDKKVELGRRLALAASAVAYTRKNSTVFAGPRAVSAFRHGETAVMVRFQLSAGVPAIAFNATAACPTPTLNVFCTGAGFEVQVGGVWSAADVSVASLQPPAAVLLRAAGHDATAVDRVRYAYADWPVVSVRNALRNASTGASELGLPAPLFDLAVAAAPLPARPECNPSNGCTVCAACCQGYVPDGKACSACVAKQCV